MLEQLFGRREKKLAAATLYAAIMAQSRQAHFYSHWAVADSLDGRFEMLVIHAFLVIRRIKGSGEAGKKLAQQVFDAMFTDLDRALRESGVSDVAVPKKIKAMAQAFYGRAAHYEEALGAADSQALTQALTRNVFPDADSPGDAAALGAYMRQVAGHLEKQTDPALIEGTVTFPPPATIGEPHE